jgi:hypothetical protein
LDDFYVAGLVLGLKADVDLDVGEQSADLEVGL